MKTKFPEKKTRRYFYVNNSVYFIFSILWCLQMVYGSFNKYRLMLRVFLV